MKTKECPSCAMEIDAKSEECPICHYEFAKTNIGNQFIAIILVIITLIYLIL